jgi:hypothetical protein
MAGAGWPRTAMAFTAISASTAHSIHDTNYTFDGIDNDGVQEQTPSRPATPPAEPLSAVPFAYYGEAEPDAEYH